MSSHDIASEQNKSCTSIPSIDEINQARALHMQHFWGHWFVIHVVEFTCSSERVQHQRLEMKAWRVDTAMTFHLSMSINFAAMHNARDRILHP